MDAHIHFIAPQQIDDALHSGITTMLGGGTGPAHGTLATTFKNKGHDGRLEFVHAPLAGWHGVFGLQTTRRDFSAIGAEAYVPPTLTKKHAAFLTEEYKLGNVRFEAAVRHEWQDVDVEVDKPDSHTRGTSLSVGAVWK